MSRSFKEPIYKDGSGPQHAWYRKAVRRKSKHLIRNEIYDIPHRNSLVNQYDYSDYVSHFYFEKGFKWWCTPEDEKAARRK